MDAWAPSPESAPNPRFAVMHPAGWKLLHVPMQCSGPAKPRHRQPTDSAGLHELFWPSGKPRM